MEKENIQLIYGDCLELMKDIPSGSTGAACVNTYRRFIGMENETKYFKTAKQRIENAAFSYAKEGENTC